MEASEVHDFVENLESSKESRLFEVSFSIAVLAVLVAMVTVMSHRAHTSAVLNEARATDEWGLYQAKRIRQTDIATTSDLLAVLAPNNPAAAAKLRTYRMQTGKWDTDLAESQGRAHALEQEVERAEHRASRFDLSEALLQIAVVLASVTLLTRQRIYWLLGLTLGVAGSVFAVVGFLTH